MKPTFTSGSVSWSQLDAGALKLDRRTVHLGALRVACHACNLGFKAEGDLEPDTSLIGILAGPSVDTRWFGAAVDESNVAVSGESIWLKTEGPAAFLSVKVDARRLRDRFPSAPEAQTVIENTGETRLEYRPHQAPQLRSELHWLLRDITRWSGGFVSIEARGMLERALMVLLADVVAGSSAGVERSPALNRRIAAVRVCEAYMNEHMDAPVTLLDLSRISGLRLRSLINAFRAITGFSPMAYFKRQRLSGVHQALQRCDKDRTRIIDVATYWGFWHMGHFTADYREMFGEVPSQTLCNTSQ